ncbi:MAG: LamG domain-containing protein, partial [Fidelibacterota bacterium]
SKLGHPEEASGGFDLSVAADGKLYGTIYYLGNQYFVFSNNTLAVGEWNHVAMSWIGDGDLTLYINGEYEGSFNAPIGSITNTAPVKIGVMSWNNTRYFNGQIDVVRMWGTARSQIEILSGMYGRMDVNEAGLVSAWRMDEGSGTVVSDLTSNNNDGTLSGGTWEVVDPAVTSNTSTAFITIQPVNDSPSFTKGSDQVVNEDSGETTVADWATLISAGPLDELSQTLHFEVTTDNDNLFSALPAVDPNGELTFTPANDMYGTAIVSVVLYDDGGTARSGSDHSVAQTFNITINPVNDEPMFVISSDLTVNEDDGSPDINFAATAKTIPDFISSIDLGPQNEITDFNQTPDFSLTTNNDGLFEILPEINSGGTLTYQLAHNNYGTAEITVVLNDGGGTDNIGDDSSVGTFQISVNPVNDFPSFTIGENQSILEDDGNTSITEAGSEHLIIGWATNIDLGPENEITDFNQNATFILTTDNDGLFSVLPTITPSGDLSYTSALNQYGDAIVTIVLSDNGGTDFGGVDTT